MNDLKGDLDMPTIADRINEVIDRDIKPALGMHGGGVDFVSFDEGDGVLRVSLTGMCNGCPHAQATISGMVEGVIQQFVPEVKEVVPV